ncbi:hypothetical protein ACVBGC_33690 [Burkholderia stagnalis]
MTPYKQKSPTCPFAIIGSFPKCGRRGARTNSGLTAAGLSIACVGDIVAYEDRSEAATADGASEHAAGDDKSLALLGSRMSNGDRIVESFQRLSGVHVVAGQIADGPFDPVYVLKCGLQAGRVYRAERAALAWNSAEWQALGIEWRHQRLWLQPAAGFVCRARYEHVFHG